MRLSMSYFKPWDIQLFKKLLLANTDTILADANLAIGYNAIGS